MNKYQNKIKNNNINKIYKIKYDNNLIESKEEEKENENNEKKEDKNDIVEMNNNKNKKEEKGELDLTYNFDDDVFNVTQEQMDILDGDVNKIFNRYKNNIEFNNFRLNHPKLQYKNRYDNNYGYIDNHITKEERQKRISPIIEKQKLILEKIKKDNISRSNILLNNDPDNQTKNKITKSNKFIYPYKLNQINNLKGNIFTNNNQKNNELYSSSNHNTIDFNNYNNNNIFSNYKNNNIMRYQNLYINNGPLSSEDRSNISSKYKINKDKRKINYKPNIQIMLRVIMNIILKIKIK